MEVLHGSTIKINTIFLYASEFGGISPEAPKNRPWIFV
jgi:hypothetical protein